MMFSPTLKNEISFYSMTYHDDPYEVVSAVGPAASLADNPNLPHCFRSATRGLTTSLCVVNRIRRVVLTFLPSSLNRHVTIVLVPSLLVVVVP